MAFTDPKQKTVAVILDGAVARGAFEAGVLRVLADTGVRVARIVAVSSGALNGAYFASAVRAGRAAEGARALIELWRRTGWSRVFQCNPIDIVGRQGISNTNRLRALLRANIHPVRVADPAPINLRIIVAPIEGVDGRIGDRPATTYEQMLEFDGADFDGAAALERVFTAATASASLPVLFTPTEVPGLGDCVDGGGVNNDPIGYALDGEIGAQVDAVIVVAPIVARKGASARRLRGSRLIGQLLEMLFSERIYRDLKTTAQINAALANLNALVPGTLDVGQLAAVKRALGWEGARVVEVIPIRPSAPLPGTPLSGLFRRAEREAYIATGIARAEQVLRERGWR